MDYPCTHCEIGKAPYACDGDCDKKQAYKRLQSQAEYMELAKLAFDMVMQTMQEGEQTHEKGDWRKQSIINHAEHGYTHINNYINGKAFKEFETAEDDDIAHTVTRLAMIRWKEMRQENG